MKHAPLHDGLQAEPIVPVDAPRELSFEEMDAVAGGNHIKGRLAIIKLKAKGHGCTNQILLACLDIL